MRTVNNNRPTRFAAAAHRLTRLDSVLAGVLIVALLSGSSFAAGEETFSVSYSGRLTLGNGAPVEGPVDIDVSFWSAVTDGAQRGRSITKPGVNLINGLFTIDLPLSGPDLAAVYGNGTSAVYIEVTAAGKTYPRQRFLYTPLALRIPVDESHFEYSDTSGKLRIKMDSAATDGSVMTSDGRGGFTWKKIDAAQLVTQPTAAVTGLSAVAPITIGGSGTAPTIGITRASGTASGYLSSTDWTTFNTKQDVLGFAPLNKAGDTLGGPLNMNGKALTGLATPTNASDAASKDYVDGLALRKDGSVPLNAAWDVGAKAIVNIGNVGIGSTEPSAKLDVIGQIKIQGGSPGAGKVLTSDATGLASWNAPAVGSVTSVNTGVGLSGGPINGSGTISLADTNVTPGTYNRATISVDQKGRLTSASSGAAIVDADIDAAANIAQTKISGLGTSLAGKEPTIAGGTTSQYWRGDKSWQALNSDAVTEGTNQYFTAARAKGVFTATAPVSYNFTTGDISIAQASGTTNGYLSSTDWATFNNKQNALGYAPLNKAGDTITGNLVMASAKVFGLSPNAADPALSGDADEGKMWFNSTSNELKFWDGSTVKTLGVAGSGLQSFNGQSGNSQTFATPGTAGNAPDWSSSGNIHTLNIPMASVTNVTAGLISNADYTAFKSKVSSVTQGTGIEVNTASGISTVSLTNTAVTPGSYTRANILVDAQGRLTAAQSAAAIVDGDIAAGAAIAQSKVSGLTTDLAAKEPTVTAGTSTQYYRGDKTWQTLTTTNVAEGTNQYFTPARAISALSGSAPISYSTVTGTIGISQASGAAHGYLSSTDWSTFNSKQNALGYTPVNKAGDTMAGALNAGGFDIANAGNIQMAASKTLALSSNTTDPAGLTAADKGKTWYNITSNQIKYWDGNSAIALGSAGGENWAAPGAIGASTPNSAAFTSVTSNFQAGYEAKPYGTAVGNTSEVRFDELAANGTNYVGFKAPDVISANKVWVLPATDGTAGQVLKTDGAGNLGWASDGGGTVTSVSGTAPLSVATGTSTPVVSMTQANTTNAGYLSAADWNTFNGKQAAGSYLTTLTGDVTTSAFSAGSATATLASVALAGTATKVTYDVKGRVTSGTSLTAADLPSHSAALITTGTLAVANGGTGLTSTPSNGQIPIGNGTGYSLANLNSGTGINITNSAGAVTIESTADPATKVSLAGDTMTGGLNLPTNGLNIGNGQFTAANGNVGIGTTAPGSILHLYGANPSITLQPTAGGPQSGIQFVTPTNTAGMSIGRDRNSTGTNDMFFYDQVAGATRMYISSTGNVGIGTSTPTSSLTILANTSYNNNENGAHGLAIRSGLGSQSLNLGYDGTNDVAYINASKTAAYPPLALQSRGGNVGVGTTSPDKQLDVVGNVASDNYIVRRVSDGNETTMSLASDASNYLRLTNVSGNRGFYINTYTADGNRDIFFAGSGGSVAGTPGMIRAIGNTNIIVDGNIGIGTINPTASLDVNGTIKGNIPAAGSYSETIQTTTTRNQWINSNVNVTVPVTGTYLIQMNARMWALGTNDNWWKARVYDETSSTQLCVAIGLGYSGTMSKADGTVGMTRTAFLTAGDVLRLQFAINGSDTNTIYFSGDGNGGSGLSIMRVSN